MKAFVSDARLGFLLNKYLLLLEVCIVMIGTLYLESTQRNL